MFSRRRGRVCCFLAVRPNITAVHRICGTYCRACPRRIHPERGSLLPYVYRPAQSRTAPGRLNRCSPFRHSEAALHVVNLSLVRRKLSFALQLPSGYSCPPAVLDLRPLCVSTRLSLHLSPPCSTFQAVVQKSLFSDNPIDPLEQTSSKQVASPCPLRGFVIKHAMLSPDITTDS